MGIKLGVGLTEIIMMVLSTAIIPILGAPTMAVFLVLAMITCCRQPFFQISEFEMLFGVEHIDQSLAFHIAQFPFGFHIEITRVHITIVFNNQILPTLFLENTLGAGLPQAIEKH